MEHSYTVDGTVNWYCHYGYIVEVTLKTKKRTTIWPSDPIPGYIHRENHNPKNCHIKWSKSDRKRQISYDIAYMWNLKQGTNELIYKIESQM